MELTEKDIEDLKVVVDLAESSEYHDHTNDESCKRVRLLIKRFKAVDYDALFKEKYNEEPSVGSCYPSYQAAEVIYDGSKWITLH